MAQTIVLFSTKGGVGKTLIATSLAVTLAQDERRKVCLVDLDIQGVGDAARILGLRPQKSMADLLLYFRNNAALAPEALESVITRSSLGFNFLPGVLKPQQAAKFDGPKIKSIFTGLERNNQFIIVDAGRAFSELFITVLNQANLILMVVTPDVLSIYQTKWAIDTLQFLHLPLAMIKIVLNRADSASSISLQDISASLPVQILSNIPSEGKSVGFAVNRGIPIVLDSPRSKISVSVKKLGHDLAFNEALFLPRTELDQVKAQEVMVEKTSESPPAPGFSSAVVDETPAERSDELLLLKRKIQTRLIEELNLKRLDSKVFTDLEQAQELRAKAEMAVVNILAEESSSFIAAPEVRKKVVKEILDEALGLGPLEDLLADAAVTDILVNNKDRVYVERNGKLELTSKKFISNDQVKITIERIIAPIGRRIDESVPMVDARLSDGSRVNAIIPPLSLTGPTIAIRKFRRDRFKMDELIAMNTLSRSMADFLRACVLIRKNIIVSGGTGTGKTTNLNVLSSFIRDTDRIISIEDAAELRLHQEHWVRLEARPANIEGKGAITVRDLFRNTLRMRPDRIIIGECRGSETLDMLQAMNTGHDGSMTTIHANSTFDVLSRLDSMILMSGVELPLRALREMIASAIHLIVHTARMSDGTRKVVQISELTGMTDDLHIGLKDIFIFKQTGIDAHGNVEGVFTAVGYIPSFFNEFRIRKIDLSEELFKSAPDITPHENP